MKAASESQNEPILLDVVMYLAELVSDPHAIDQSLDSIREVTSQLRPEAKNELDPQAIAKLQAVQANLKRYLIEEEPLRSFTAESLERQIYDHFQGRKTLHRLRWSLAAIYVLTTGAALSSIVGYSANQSIRILSTVAALCAIPTVGAVWFFLLASKNFKPELRVAYRFVASGMVFSVCSPLTCCFWAWKQRKFRNPDIEGSRH